VIRRWAVRGVAGLGPETTPTPRTYEAATRKAAARAHAKYLSAQPGFRWEATLVLEVGRAPAALARVWSRYKVEVYTVWAFDVEAEPDPPRRVHQEKRK